jgi:hypothetical protein
MPAYEPTELPPDNADFGPSHDEITAELLTLTHNFFDQASTAVRDELRQFLTNRGHHPITGLEAFLDRLQFSATLHHNPSQPPTT